MTTPLGFDELQALLHRRIDHLPDHRKPGPNTSYALPDAAFGAFGIFFTQSPSFLEYQRHLQQTQGHNNASTLFGVETIPCNNQIRNLLDPLMPSHLDRVYLEVFERLEQHGSLATFRVLSDQLLAGPRWHPVPFLPQRFIVQTVSGVTLSNGQTLYYHSAITPVIVCPGAPR